MASNSGNPLWPSRRISHKQISWRVYSFLVSSLGIYYLKSCSKYYTENICHSQAKSGITVCTQRQWWEKQKHKQSEMRMSIESFSPPKTAPVPHHSLELGDHWGVAVGRGEGGVERLLGHWRRQRDIHVDRHGFKCQGWWRRGRGESGGHKWERGVGWTNYVRGGWSPQFGGLVDGKVLGKGVQWRSAGRPFFSHRYFI